MAEKGTNFTYERALTRRQAGRAAIALPASYQTRLLEALPGVLSWVVVMAPIWLTMVDPTALTLFMAVAIGVFMVRAGPYGLWALLNRNLILKGTSTDWLARLDQFPDWQQHRVILLIRAYREGNRSMLTQTLSAIYGSRWTRDGQMMPGVEVVFATEANDPITPPLVEELAAEFKGRLRIRQVIHPREPQVLPGPSSAMHYVGRVLYREAMERGEDPRRVLIADLDADTVMHPNYLSCLLYHYVSDPRRDRHVYQPMVLFTLDYWRAPLHSRLSALGTSTLTLGWIREPEIAFTGAAASLALYQSVDFWPTQSHSQDSGVDLKLSMRYGREYRVIGLPIPLKVYPVMIVGDPKGWRARLKAYWQSLRVLFRQSARWREGPLDEFIEASRRGHVYLTLQRLWWGLERDTLAIVAGAGFLFAKFLAHVVYPGYDYSTLELAATVILAGVSLLGLIVFWQMLSLPGFVEPVAGPWRRILEMLMFWLVFSIYMPILTAVAGLKTSTSYALGHRPTGHYTPTPK